MANSESTNVLAVIPARYASSRFPGKPLASIAGRPMIQHVVERVRQARSLSGIVVATDDERIGNAAKDFGVEALLTRPDHRTGTDRVAEVAVHLPAEIYVNVQGDEPLIDPGAIDALVSAMQEDPAVRIATLCSAITQASHIMDPNIVKVVRDFEGNALYFSRAPVPWVRDTAETSAVRHWKHRERLRERRAAS